MKIMKAKSLSNKASGKDSGDSLVGRNTSNVLMGGAGNDTLDGSTGADKLVGGAGNDTYIIDNKSDTIAERRDAGTDEVITSLHKYSLPKNVENLSVADGATGDFFLKGNSANNAIVGGSGNDTLIGGGYGNDVFKGNAGDNTIIGKPGDIALYNGVGDTVLYNGARSDYTIERPGQNTLKITNIATNDVDLVSNVDYYIFGTGDNTKKLVFSDVITNVLSDFGCAMIGDDGDNVLMGGKGSDGLRGGYGADTMIGGYGNDSYQADNSDTIIELKDGGYDTVVIKDIIYIMPDNVEKLLFQGSDLISLIFTGNASNNQMSAGDFANVALFGKDGNDELFGDYGNDTLDGGAGIDTLSGGSGNDIYIIDNKKDKIIDNEEAAISDANGFNVSSFWGGNDTIQTTLFNFKLGNYLENLTYTGTQSFKGEGNTLNNILTGATGNDILKGGIGDDSLFGGTGTDTLTGGAGNDTFAFDKISIDSTKIITDFTSGTDKLGFNSTAFNALSWNVDGSLSNEQFASGTSSIDAKTRIVFDTTTGHLYYDADGVGGADIELIGTLSNHPSTLSALDFIAL
jgi:Ca2+-binding RTX toxin-like protein